MAAGYGTGNRTCTNINTDTGHFHDMAIITGKDVGKQAPGANTGVKDIGKNRNRTEIITEIITEIVTVIVTVIATAITTGILTDDHK